MYTIEQAAFHKFGQQANDGTVHDEADPASRPARTWCVSMQLVTRGSPVCWATSGCAWPWATRKTAGAKRFASEGSRTSNLKPDEGAST